VRRIHTLLVAAVVLDVGYWTAWYADRALVASNTRGAYYEFENAFPLADGWLALCCLAALITLRRRSPLAVLWLLAGGGAGVYLFAMDVLYDLEQGIWWSSGAGGAIELVVNIVTIVFAVVLLRWTWRNHAVLLAGGAAVTPSASPAAPRRS
jgi:hypothetical protein